MKKVLVDYWVPIVSIVGIIAKIVTMDNTVLANTNDITDIKNSQAQFQEKISNKIDDLTKITTITATKVDDIDSRTIFIKNKVQ